LHPINVETDGPVALYPKCFPYTYRVVQKSGYPVLFLG